MSVRNTIKAKLAAALEPTLIEVTDVSARHKGHAGWRPGGETHFDVLLVSPRFQGQSRIARHRMVNSVLEKELTDSIHALSLDVYTPDEFEKKSEKTTLLRE